MKYLILFIAGIITWTLLEYIIHRFFGHKKKGKGIIKKEHLKHHREGHYFAPFRKKFALAFVFLSVTTLLVAIPDFLIWLDGLIFSSGLAGMYVLYELTHRLFHTNEPLIKYGYKMRKHHFYHHFSNPKANHGVTVAFWDKVFGTYISPKEIYVPKRLAMDWLLDKNKTIKKEYTANFRLR